MSIIRKHLLKFVLLIVILIMIPVLGYFNFLSSKASSGNKDVQVRITKGMNSNSIINKLYEKKLIKNKFYAKVYMKLNGTSGNLKAGVYKFNINMTPVKIFAMLKNREIDMDFVVFTIPEGYTIKQIGLKMYNLELIKSVDELYNCVQNDSFDYEFVRNLGRNRTFKLEGYLFPDTYEFEKGMPIHFMVDQMLKRFNLVYNTYKNQVDDKKMPLDKVIIMASMIEGEAKLDSERPIIASVLFNRLKVDMKLQIDATVQYALGEHKSILYLRDLRIDSPYNTYKYKGLPVGPICNPGKKSIEAVLNPSESNYIYYIAKGDGGHFFTNSYKKFLSVKNSLKK